MSSSEFRVPLTPINIGIFDRRKRGASPMTGYRAQVMLTLFGKNDEKIVHPFVLDTGSDISCVPENIAKALGLLGADNQSFTRISTSSCAGLQVRAFPLTFAFTEFPDLKVVSTFACLPPRKDRNDAAYFRKLARLLRSSLWMLGSGAAHTNVRQGVLAMRDILRYCDVIMTRDGNSFVLRVLRRTKANQGKN